jgi:hypothetical protein
VTPRYHIEATDETVLIKPNGTMEFWQKDRLINVITFSGEPAALEYAKARRWKEIQPV